METHQSPLLGDLIIMTTSTDGNDENDDGSSTIGLLEKHFHGTSLKKIEIFRKREILLNEIKNYSIIDSLSFGYVWEYKQLSREFLHDREIVIEGLKKSIYKYSELSDELKMDKDVVLASVLGDAIDGFEQVSDDFKKDRELVFKVLGISAYSLRYVSDKLKADREVVLKAINTSGLAIQFASQELRRDMDLVIEAVKGISKVIEYLDADIIKSIIDDRECLEEIISENPYSLTDFIFVANCIDLAKDKGLFRIALEKTRNAQFVRFMDTSLKEDKEFILELMDIKKEVFRYLSDVLKNDADIKHKMEL